MSDLYGTDILLWAEHQADLAPPTAGELVNAMLRGVTDVAEEIEDVGRTQLRTVELLLVQALRHMLKAEGCGGSPELRRAGGPMRSISAGRPGVGSCHPCGRGSM